jgi:glutamyl-tRNA reductase
MEETFRDEDIEQLLAEADEFLSQIDEEIMEYLEEGQRAQFEEQAQSLRQLRSEVQERIAKKGPEGGGAYSEGVHEAIDDIVKAMKSLSSFLS